MSKKKKSSKPSNFNAQEFMLFHVEKFVFALIAVLAVGVAYLGFSQQAYDSSKTPDKLKQTSDQTLTRIKESHWDAIAKEPDRAPPPYAYTEDAVRTSQKISDQGYQIDIGKKGPNSGLGRRRSDPQIFAPTSLEPKFFSGAVLSLNANPKTVEALSKLADAKEKEEKPKKENNKSGAGNNPYGNGGRGGPGGGAGGAPGGYGGTGGPPGGYGGTGGALASPSNNAKRVLATGYDRGFPSHAFRAPEPEKDAKKPVVGPRSIQFVTVNALAPHAENETAYTAALKGSNGYMEGRDTPNYTGFEVQRADVTSDPNKQLADSDWQDLPDAGSEKLKDLLKALKANNTEVYQADWTTTATTMPIPPVLLKDYKAFATHSEIPTTGQSASVAITTGGGSGSSDEESASSSSSSMGSFAGLGGGSSMPAGYGSSGAPSGYGGGSGSSMPAGYGSSGMPSGYGGGSGSSMPAGYGSSGMPSGYGGGSSSMPSGYGGVSTGTTVAPTAEAPKVLPSTKYKAIRFYDFRVEDGKIYRYRVRLLMYDPNLPEAKGIQPRSATLDSATLARVQPVIQAELKEAATKDEPKRKSARTTDWSEPSPPIGIVKANDAFVGHGDMSYSQDKFGHYENRPSKAEVVLAEWDKSSLLYIPRKDSVERGYVFGGPNKDSKGKEAPFEVIHLVDKVIKQLPKAMAPANNLVTMVDVRGMINLEMKPSKDQDCKSGTEAVAYDPVNGQLIVMREFDDYTNYKMFVEPDQTAVGPLGGPMQVTVNALGGMGGGGAVGGATGGSGNKPSFGGSSGGSTAGSGTGATDSSN